jgi:hypothetical protein
VVAAPQDTPDDDGGAIAQADPATDEAPERMHTNVATTTTPNPKIHLFFGIATAPPSQPLGG